MNPPTAALRPGFGTVGRKIKVRTNVFPVQIKPESSVFVYNVSFNDDSGREAPKWHDKKVIIAKAIEIFPPDCRDAIAFDGSHLVISAEKLEFEKIKLVTDSVAVIPVSNTEATINVSWKNRNRIVVTTVNWLLVREESFDPNEVVNPILTERDLMSLQTLNILMRHSLLKANQGFEENRRQFSINWNSLKVFSNSLNFDPKLPRGRIISLGFSYSNHVLSGHQYRLLFDVATSAYYEEQPVLDFMRGILGETYGEPLDRRQSEIFEKEMKKLKIIQKGNQYVHEVIGITQSGADSLTFQKNDEELNVAMYFADKGEPLKFPRLQCLHVGKPNKTIFIPMEVAILLYQPCRKGKNKGEVDSMMIRKTCLAAELREQMTIKILHASGLLGNPVLHRFGVSVSHDPIITSARILEAPELVYRVEDRLVNVRPKDGQWKLNKEEFIQGAEVKTWSLISFHQQQLQPKLEKFCEKLVEMANICGMIMEDQAKWPTVVKYCRYPEDLHETVNRCLIETETKMPGQHVDFILVSLDVDKDDPKYGEVKRVGDTVFGVVTQCFGPRVLNVVTTNGKSTSDMLANLVSKLNSKLNGTNCHIARNAIVKRIFDQPVLVMGIDVIHAGFLPIHPSIAAVVGLKGMMTKAVYSATKCQNHGEEHIALEEITSAMIGKYRDLTQNLPQVILVFRDGIDDGKFAQALTGELHDIKQACNKEYGYSPKITYIIVKKRHKFKLYPRDSKESCGKSGNVHPGTVIDSEVTHPNGFDFYLCSHYGAMGTSKCAHYHVLCDENNLSADEVQQICYQQCHLADARTTKTSSIPAPVKWADSECSKAFSRLVAYENSEAGSLNDSEEELHLEQMSSAIAVHENVQDHPHYV